MCIAVLTLQICKSGHVYHSSLPAITNELAINRETNPLHSVLYSSSNTPNMNGQNLNCEERLVLFMFASHVQWYDTPWRQANTTR